MAVEQVVNSGLKLKTVESIPAKWRIHQVDELFSFLKTNSLSRNDLSYDYPEFPIYNIHYGDIHATFDSSVLDFEKESRVPVIKSMNHLPKEVDYLSEGDLIMADASEDYDGVGEAIEILNLKGRQVLAGLHTIALRGDHRTALGFRSYIFKHPGVVKSLRVIATGTKVYGISKSNVSKLRVILPPLPEQRKIAEILSTWDEAIAQTKALIEQLKLRNKGLAQQLLTGKKRLKGFSGEWKTYKFEELLKTVKRPVDWDDEALYKLISVRRRSGGIFYREALYGKQIKVKNLKTAKTGDFLFSKMQIVHGASALVTSDFDDAKISGSYISVRSKNSDLLNIEFLNWYSKLPVFYHQTYTSSYGVHIEKMTFDFKLFLRESINLPPLVEQTRIVTILKEADTELRIQEDKLGSLVRQKKGLMQKLLTGEVRVKIDANGK